MPTQITERAPRATPRTRFTASAFFALPLALLLALNAAPVAAQLAMDFTTDASGRAITAHTGYTANCAAQTASVPEQSSSVVTPDVGFALANQSMCAITRRMEQARSDSNVDTGRRKTTFWGGGYYDSEFDSEIFSVEFDGRLRTAYLGFDMRPRNNLLTGLMMSRSEVDINYAFFTSDGREAQSGDYDMQVTSANPYINWSAPDGRLELWAMAGYGKGELKISEGDFRDALTSDVVLRTLGVGVSRSLSKGGNREVRMKADVLSARTKVGSARSRGATVAGVKADVHRVRLMLEASRAHILFDSVQLKPSVDMGVRFDDQEEETGTGTEVGVSLRYTDLVTGLTVNISGRTLIEHNRDDENGYEDYYNEWDFSIGGSWRQSAGDDGEGLSFSVGPGYGEIADGGRPTWQALLGAVEKESRMSARVEYGLPAFGGLLAPYSEMPIGESNKVYRLGARWSLDSFLNMKLTGEQRNESHAISLTGEMRF